MKIAKFLILFSLILFFTSAAVSASIIYRPINGQTHDSFNGLKAD